MSEMLRLTKTEQCAGKTVAEFVEYSSYPIRLAIKFTDGSYVVLGIDYGYEGDADIEISSDELSDDDQLRLGLIDETEFKRRREDDDRKNAVEREASERRQLAALKARYENESG